MKEKHWLILILVTAALLNLYGLSRGDTVNDEVFYGFRAIGMMDFDEAENQTTPLEWFDPDIPFWTKLSFHDHPPLVFLIQHISIALFGENNFALRLPSALLGIASVYLIYLIGVILYSIPVGLLSAGIFGLTLNHVYISRTGMQEAYVIFFLLLASFLFLKSLKKDTYLIWTGVVLGFAFITKYTAFILIPIFLTYLFIYKRDYFLNKKFWAGALISLAIFSPVIFYNLKLYQAVGHFDFQLSHVFGQETPLWQVVPGKEIGTLSERISNFIPRLVSTHSWIFLLAFISAVVAFFIALLKNAKKTLQKNAFLIITILYLLLLLLLIGPSFRFLTMLTPFMAIAIAIPLGNLVSKFTWTLGVQVVFAAFIAFEIFYSVNNQITYYPLGPEPWLASKVRYENYNWGNNELGDFLKKEFKNKMPALTFRMQYEFLEEVQDDNLEKARSAGFEPYPALVVTHGNFDRGAKLWVLDRLHIYHGWPIINLETYFKHLEENGFDYYDQVGFKNYYFILQTNIVPYDDFNALVQNLEPISIYNKRGGEVFKIYKF